MVSQAASRGIRLTEWKERVMTDAFVARFADPLSCEASSL